MSSIQLPSFIYDKSKKISNLAEQKPELGLGPLSKVKRFGSKLIRSKTLKESPSRPNTLELKIPPSTDSKNIRDSQSSLAVSSVASSIEEHVKTPTTADYCKQTFDLDSNNHNTTETRQEYGTPMAVTEEKIEEETEEETEEVEEAEEPEEAEVEINDESKLSGLPLIRYHLAVALKEADKEIDQEFKEKRKNMLKTLNSFPKLFYK